MKVFGLLVVAGMLAASTGFFVAQALGVGTQEPSRTVTIDVTGATGPQGPPGPAGPPGQPGAASCPAGSTFGEAKFVQQGKGPVSLLTCIKD